MLFVDKTESDNINRMIKIICDFYILIFSEWNVEM